MASQFSSSNTSARATEPRAEHVRAQLNRLLKSGRLNSSEHRRKFLRYVVEETLEGRSDTLKGFTIAVEVYGRDESFDATTDPVVRLEARRLRRDLDSYYMDAGATDPVRISIPKGGYIPRFEWRDGSTVAAPEKLRDLQSGNTPAPSQDARLHQRSPFGRQILTGAAVTMVMFAVLVMFWGSFDDRSYPPRVKEPQVLVLPFQGIGNDDLIDDLASGITFDVIDNLTRFQGFRVFAPYGDPAALEKALEQRVGTANVPGYIVHGNVEMQGNVIYVSARLSSVTNREVLWANRWNLALSPVAIVDLQHDIANKIAADIGQPYGIVVSGFSQGHSHPEAKDLPSYLCVQRAFNYRRSFGKDEYGPVLACLERAVRTDPQYSDAWAMLGWLYLDAGRLEFAEIDDRQQQYLMAFEAASKAVALDPVNTTALKSLAAINHYMGRFEESEHLARRALHINPNDPDTLAQLGWRLVVRGNFEEGIPALEQAIERSLNPPFWYFCFTAIHQLKQNDYRGVLETTQEQVDGSCQFTPALRAIASARLGRPVDTREALRLLDENERIARDPPAYFDLHGFSDALRNEIVSGLEQARAFVEPDRWASQSDGQH